MILQIYRGCCSANPFVHTSGLGVIASEVGWNVRRDAPALMGTTVMMRQTGRLLSIIFFSYFFLHLSGPFYEDTCIKHTPHSTRGASHIIFFSLIVFFFPYIRKVKVVLGECSETNKKRFGAFATAMTSPFLSSRVGLTIQSGALQMS